MHPEDTGLLVERWQKVIRTKMPGELDARLRRFDGQYRWFTFRGAPLLDPWGHVVKWHGINVDIEAQKHAGEEMSMLVSLIENSTDFIGYASSPREVSYINGAWRKLAGLAAHEDLSAYEMSDFLPAPDYRRFLQEIMPALERHGSDEHGRGKTA